MDRVEDLLNAARGILASTRLPVAASGHEADVAMDFLAERDDFMTLLDENATRILGRSSRGPGDLAFEAVMVDLMSAVEGRLKEGWGPRVVLARRHRQSTTIG